MYSLSRKCLDFQSNDYGRRSCYSAGDDSARLRCAFGNQLQSKQRSTLNTKLIATLVPKIGFSIHYNDIWLTQIARLPPFVRFRRSAMKIANDLKSKWTGSFAGKKMSNKPFSYRHRKEILAQYPHFEMWILEIFTLSGQNITSRGAASRGDIWPQEVNIFNIHISNCGYPHYP